MAKTGTTQLSCLISELGLQTDAKRNELRREWRGDDPTLPRLPRVRRNSCVSRPRNGCPITKPQTGPKMGPHGMQSVPDPRTFFGSRGKRKRPTGWRLGLAVGTSAPSQTGQSASAPPPRGPDAPSTLRGGRRDRRLGVASIALAQVQQGTGVYDSAAHQLSLQIHFQRANASS